MDSSADADDKAAIQTADGQPYRKKQFRWCYEDTAKLIEMYRTHRELWDYKHPFYALRHERLMTQNKFAEEIGTTPEEIARKLRNLRSQYTAEERKLKKKNWGSKEPCSTWEYYQNLTFLKTRTKGETFPQDETSMDDTMIEAEVDGLEEDLYDDVPSVKSNHSGSPVQPIQAEYVFEPQRVKRGSGQRKGIARSSDEVFGDFVYTQLCSIRSEKIRRKLKIRMQKAILKALEDDASSESGSE